MRKLIHLSLRVAEHHSKLEITYIYQSCQNISLVLRTHFKIILFGVRDRNLRLSDLNLDRISQILLCNCADLRRHSCRKENCLSCGLCNLPVPSLSFSLFLVFQLCPAVDIFKYCINVFLESHIKHFISFIKDEILQTIKSYGLSSHMIHETARRRDYDLRLSL